MNLQFREALESDVPILVKMLSEDELGAMREDNSLPVNQDYLKAFYSIDDDPNNELTVVENNGEILGMLQLTFIPYLSHIGSWRCLIVVNTIECFFDGRNPGFRASGLFKRSGSPEFRRRNYW